MRPRPVPDARRRLASIQHSQENGDLTDARGQRLGAFLDVWLEEIVKPSVRTWTYRGYEVHVRLHIKPALGQIALDTQCEWCA